MGFFSLFSNSCKNVTSAVQQRRQNRSHKHEDFLRDIELLNKQIEMAERNRLMDTSVPHAKAVGRKSGKFKPSMQQQQQSSTPTGTLVMQSGGDYPHYPQSTNNEYVAMEQAQQEKFPGGSDEKPVGKGESLLDFFWELISFAKNRSWKKKLMTALIAASSMYVLIDLIFLGHITKIIQKFLTWCSYQPGAAVACFLSFFVLATFLFVPPTILYFGAGYAFAKVAGFWAGLFVAIITSFIGSCLGALLAFVRSRYMMRDLVELFSKRFPIVKCLDQAIEKKGFHVMLMLRLCPILPFNALNYVGGVTKISMEEYTFALVGVIPNIVLWVLVGASAENIRNQEVEKDDKAYFIFMVCSLASGIIFAGVGIYLLYRYGRDELHKEIKEQRAVSWLEYAKDQNEPLPPETFYDPNGEIEQGFEAMERSSGLASMYGIDQSLVETHAVPSDGRDEDWLWVWA